MAECITSFYYFFKKDGNLKLKTGMYRTKLNAELNTHLAYRFIPKCTLTSDLKFLSNTG